MGFISWDYEIHPDCYVSLLAKANKLALMSEDEEQEEEEDVLEI